MACFPWDEVEELLGTELKTLGTVEIFKLLDLDEMDLWIKPRAGSKKEVSREALDRAWHQLLSGRELDLPHLQAMQDKRGSYMAGILRRLDGVNWESNPVRIWLTPPHGITEPTVPSSSGPVIGNPISLRYQRPDCIYVGRGSDKTRIKFPSASSARQRGYSPCGACDPGT